MFQGAPKPRPVMTTRKACMNNFISELVGVIKTTCKWYPCPRGRHLEQYHCRPPGSSRRGRPWRRRRRQWGRRHPHQVCCPVHCPPVQSSVHRPQSMQLQGRVVPRTSRSTPRVILHAQPPATRSVNSVSPCSYCCPPPRGGTAGAGPLAVPPPAIVSAGPPAALPAPRSPRPSCPTSLTVVGSRALSTPTPPMAVEVKRGVPNVPTPPEESAWPTDVSSNIPDTASKSRNMFRRLRRLIPIRWLDMCMPSLSVMSSPCSSSPIRFSMKAMKPASRIRSCSEATNILVSIETFSRLNDMCQLQSSFIHNNLSCKYLPESQLHPQPHLDHQKRHCASVQPPDVQQPRRNGYYLFLIFNPIIAPTKLSNYTVL